jgi:hypothetical protein
MKRLRSDFLAGARFADQQHRRRGRRNPADLVVDRLHGGRIAEHQAEAAHTAQFTPQRANFRLQVARTRQAAQDRLHALHVDRFDEVIGRAHFQRVHRRLDRRVSGNDDDFHAGARIEILEQVHARAIGQFKVRENDVGRLAHELNPRFAQIACRGCSQSVFADDRG